MYYFCYNKIIHCQNSVFGILKTLHKHYTNLSFSHIILKSHWYSEEFNVAKIVSKFHLFLLFQLWSNLIYQILNSLVTCFPPSQYWSLIFMVLYLWSLLHALLNLAVHRKCLIVICVIINIKILSHQQYLCWKNL